MENEINSVELRMQKSIESLLHEFEQIHVNRASSALLKNVVYMKEGAKLHLLEGAVIRNVNSCTLALRPFDNSDTPAIESALRNASLGASIGGKDGEIYVIYPQMTTERRQEIVKLINTYSLNAKNALRAIRHDYMKAHKKTCKEEEAKQDKEMQKIIDKYNEKIDELSNKKQKEISQI